MIKSKRIREPVTCECRGLRGIVPTLRHTARLPDINNRRGVPARVSTRIRIAAEERNKHHLKPRLLQGLAPGGCLYRFTVVHKSPR